MTREEMLEDRRAERNARIRGDATPLPSVKPPKDPERRPPKPKAVKPKVEKPARIPKPKRALSKVGLSMPRPRRQRPAPPVVFLRKEDRECCQMARDEIGRFQVGFCGPHCLGRLQRDGYL